MPAKNVVEINLENGIHWPSRCAYCNCTASTEAKTHFRIVDAYLLVALREKVHTVRYPICDKHKFTARFYGFVTNQAWVTGFFMFLAFPALFYLFLSVLVTNDWTAFADLIAVALYATFGAWIIYLKMRNPVKIIKVKNGRANVRILNEQYAEDFKRMNACCLQGAGEIKPDGRAL